MDIDRCWESLYFPLKLFIINRNIEQVPILLLLYYLKIALPLGMSLDSPAQTVSCRQDPAAVDDGAPTEMTSALLQRDEPRELPLGGVHSSHYPGAGHPLTQIAAATLYVCNFTTNLGSLKSSGSTLRFIFHLVRTPRKRMIVNSETLRGLVTGISYSKLFLRMDDN